MDCLQNTLAERHLSGREQHDLAPRMRISLASILNFLSRRLKGLSHEIDFKNVVENGQILAFIRAAAGFLIFRRLL